MNCAQCERAEEAVRAAREAKYDTRRDRAHAIDVAERLLFMVRQSHHSGAHSDFAKTAEALARTRNETKAVSAEEFEAYLQLSERERQAMGLGEQRLTIEQRQLLGRRRWEEGYFDGKPHPSDSPETSRG